MSKAGKFVLLAAALLCAVSATVRAELVIEITQGTAVGIPVAIAPFAFEGAGEMPTRVSDVIEADLARSGRFQVLARKDHPESPNPDAEPAFDRWRALKPEGIVTGKVRLLEDGRYQVQFRLFDAIKKTELAGYSYKVRPTLLRTVAHQIADLVYEKLTGERGPFNTRIAYVSREKQGAAFVYKLQVSDSDGFNAQAVDQSTEPMLSPAWSPDGRRLAYVKFENRQARVYAIDIGTGQRETVAAFDGLNSAPAWSPDGRQLALALSRDGNPEIYVLTLATRALVRLTREPAIDTEPAFSPDGRHIVFTSDRAGKPQIYRMSSDGGAAERLTFEGAYNARASYAPDGKSIVLVSGEAGKYNIAALHLDTRALRVLTDTPLDESPSFAPNGTLIMYATRVRGRGVLASVSSDGRVRQLYKDEAGDVREPAWSPYNRELQ